MIVPRDSATRLSAAALVLLIAVCGAWAGDPDPQVATAASLIPQSGEGDDIRTRFNENSESVRLIVMLSPT